MWNRKRTTFRARWVKWISCVITRRPQQLVCIHHCMAPLTNFFFLPNLSFTRLFPLPLSEGKVLLASLLGILSAHNVKFVRFSISFYISTSALLRKNFDLHKTQSFCNFLKTFKFDAILVHHSHQSSSVWNESWGGFRNTWSESRLTCLNKWRFCFSQCTFSLKCRFL